MTNDKSSRKSHPISPLQAMALQSKQQTMEDTPVKTAIIHKSQPSKLEIKINESEQVLQVDPERICNWQYSDRPSTELGDIEAFANELKSIGQQNPCIVRHSTLDHSYDYEIIAGERRWKAAKLAGIKLKIIVRTLSDQEAALCQVAENSNRKDISEFAKGISYARLVNNGIITREQLQNKINLSRSSVRNLLSFEKISFEIREAIGDMSRISSTTAYEITRLQEKGADYISALITIAPKLASGKIGHSKLQELIEAQINNSTDTIDSAKEVHTTNGRHIFTWRKDTNGNRSITFPKSIRNFLDFERLECLLVELIDKQLNDKKSYG